MRELRLEAARGRQHGLQIMTFEQLAARLAGGLVRPVDDDALREAITAVLTETALASWTGSRGCPAWWAPPPTRCARPGGLASTYRGAPPSMPASSQSPAWRRRSWARCRRHDASCRSRRCGERAAGACAGAVRVHRDRWHHRALAGLAAPAARARLPRARALDRGPRPVRDWLDGAAIKIVRKEARTPEVAAVNAATAYHEAVEAMRWARQLLASGRAEPAEIAIASATPADYDDHLSLCAATQA